MERYRPEFYNHKKSVTNQVELCYTFLYILKYRECWITQTVRKGAFFALWGLLAALLLTVFTPAAHAEGEYDTVLDRLGRLQTLANTFVEQVDPSADPMVLTLAYTRVGEYNTDIWKLTAGIRDPEFEAYVAANDGDCQMLQGVGTVVLPNGQGIDFSHLLASLNLVYNGLPISGSWGGDCMQLAKGFQGQAGDSDGYYALMEGTFGIPDDGSVSLFGDQDLRADLDSVALGAKLKPDTELTALLRDYYDGLDDYTRVHDFITLSFGTVDTGNTAAFRETVFTTMQKDAGMQLLLYTNGMWSNEGWVLKAEYEPALRAASDLFADYLARTVGGEKVKGDAVTRMVTMAGEGLASALETLGDSSAAEAARQAHADDAVSSAPTGDRVTDAANTIKSRFDVKIFQLVLLIIAAVGVFGLIFSVVMIVQSMRE